MQQTVEQDGYTPRRTLTGAATPQYGSIGTWLTINNKQRNPLVDIGSLLNLLDECSVRFELQVFNDENPNPPFVMGGGAAVLTSTNPKVYTYTIVARGTYEFDIKLKYTKPPVGNCKFDSLTMKNNAKDFSNEAEYPTLTITAPAGVLETQEVVLFRFLSEYEARLNKHNAEKKQQSFDSFIDNIAKNPFKMAVE